MTARVDDANCPPGVKTVSLRDTVSQDVTMPGFSAAADAEYPAPKSDAAVHDTLLQAVRLAIARNLTRARIAEAA